MKAYRKLFTIVGGAVLINPAFAQEATQAAAAESGQLEEVVVSGMRGSLNAAMDTKRDAIGVVDAINAEDIGKFPDTNLSESLQRITGVSIDRRNGEGALVTARGFGPQYNMVTLNGRQMPTADAYANGAANTGGVGGDSRAFNFANLAADSVSAVEVYKTGRADIATGGIGATVNIRTARPLDSDGFVANVGVKALSDSTNRTGDDFTPDLSGIFSFANDAKTIGVGLAASYSKRDSGSVQATVNDWIVNRWDGSSVAANNGNASLWTVNPQIVNAPANGQLYMQPQDLRYAFSDTERERVNGQLTLQFVPVDSVTLTLDGTYADNEIVENRGEQGMWLARNGGVAGGFSYIEFDNSAVATPLVLRELTGAGKDFAFAQQHREQKNDLRSIGFNADWNVSDRFNLVLDFHNSRARSLPNDPVTGGSQTEFSVAGRVPGNAFWVSEFMFNSGLPIARRILYPSQANALAGVNGNPNYAFDASSIGTQMLTMNYREQQSDLKQGRLDGNFSFENGKFSFGVEARSMDSNQRRSEARAAMGNWGVADAGTVPQLFNMLTPFSVTGAFDDYNPIAGGAAPVGFRGNATQLGLWALTHYNIDYSTSTGPDGQLRYDPGFNFNSNVQEDTKAVYAQVQFQFDLIGRASNLVVGTRYEETDVFSTNNILPPAMLEWQDNNDFAVINETAVRPVTGRGSYNNLLPNLDFDIQVTDSVKTRFSYSKTLARAGYTSLAAGGSVTGGGQGSTINGFQPTGSQNNPDLLPLESDNFDLSLEYYFSDRGYVSVGAFQKNVKNFIGNTVQNVNLFGIRDQTGGPRALAALAFLQANGYTTNDSAIFQAVLMAENPNGIWTGTNTPSTADDVFWAGGLGNYLPDGDPGQAAQQAAWGAARDAAGNNVDIRPNATDPLYQFAVNTPTNNQEAKIHGFEFGGQYFFGDTGFGVLANYTIVKGDVGYNNAADPSANQFALFGLSDSANAVLMYEKYGISARLAYNWRDEFLASANNGIWRNPIYVEAYDQLDLSVGYDINDSIAVSFEVINLTGEDVRWHGRTKAALWRLEDQGPRYALGARYKF